MNQYAWEINKISEKGRIDMTEISLLNLIQKDEYGEVDLCIVSVISLIDQIIVHINRGDGERYLRKFIEGSGDDSSILVFTDIDVLCTQDESSHYVEQIVKTRVKMDKKTVIASSLPVHQIEQIIWLNHSIIG